MILSLKFFVYPNYGIDGVLEINVSCLQKKRISDILLSCEFNDVMTLAAVGPAYPLWDA